MDRFRQKWKKVVSGCVSNKSTKHSLIENDFLEYDEFNYKSSKQSPLTSSQVASDKKKDPKKFIPVFREQEENLLDDKKEDQRYDNLQHLSKKPPLANTNKNGLKDTTNVKNNGSSFAKGIKRVFKSEKRDEYDKKKEQFVYAELYENASNSNEYTMQIKQRKLNNDDENDLKKSDESHYYEIPECSMNLDDEPLLDFKNQHNLFSPIKISQQLKSAESQINLFSKFDNHNESGGNKFEMLGASETSMLQKQQQEFDIEKQCNNSSAPNLTEIRELSTFTGQSDAYHWYLNLISETMMECIRKENSINEDEKIKRFNIVTAHLLYARNFYELKIKTSINLRTTIANIHPCLITLACLLDSDAVRIVESHGCTCDTYIYLFATRLKFCAWKAKLYIILKKPKRSSIDRLTLIEDLTTCHKLIQDS